MPARDLTTPRAKNIALALLVLTQFMVVIDSSITNVALPSIGQGLTMSQDNLSWIINSYTLTFGGLLLLGGRLADFLGSPSGSPTTSTPMPRTTRALRSA